MGRKYGTMFVEQPGYKRFVFRLKKYPLNCGKWPIIQHKSNDKTRTNIRGNIKINLCKTKWKRAI